MEQKDIDKILKPGKLLLIVVIVLILATLGLVGASFYVEYEAKKDPKPLGELIENNQDKAGTYAKVQMATIPYGFAEEGEGKYYYFTMDPEGYMYIVRVTDDTYKKLEEMYNNGEGKVDYEFKGFTFTTPSKLKSLAIEATNEIFEENPIRLSDFEDYFGKVYIDETEKVDNQTVNNLQAVAIIVGAFAFIFGIILISQVVRTKKVLNNKELVEDLKEELASLNDDQYKNLKLYLTNKYIVSKLSGLEVFEYKDVIWEYSLIRYRNGIETGVSLMLVTKDKKKHELAAASAHSTRIDEIMTEIHDRNPNVRVGYSKENRDFYKNYQKQ